MMGKVIKGVWLHATLLSWLIMLVRVEHLFETDQFGTFLIWFVGNLLALNICKETISYREAYILSGLKWLDKILKD